MAGSRLEPRVNGMDAAFGDDFAGGECTLSERHTEQVLEAVKSAITAGGEHRLFRSGKLAGLFPSKAGVSAEAALFALQAGLIETVRTETRGKIITEWVQATPRAVAFVHQHDSPKSVLKELKGVLDATRAGIPGWMDEARAELARLSTTFEERANAVLGQLNELTGRVEAALRRAEAKAPTVADVMNKVVPWALAALEYLDRRTTSGAVGDCPMPELFHAIRVKQPELTLTAFQDGVRRLHDVCAVRLQPSSTMAEPEYAIVVEGQMMYAVNR